MNFKQTISDRFFKETKIPHHRYKSWIHCYKFFRKYPKKINENWLDLAALNLSMYLASWGMWRGSTVSINLDYKFYKHAIKVIIKREYNVLWNVDISELDKEILKTKISPKINGLVRELSEVLKKKLEETGNKKIDKSVTDTLITKILLGTIGCMPAYDTYFIEGRTGTKIARKLINKRKNTFDSLIDFYFDKKNKQKLDKMKSDIDKWEKRQYGNDSITYPIMKLIDMHFWTIGKKRKKKEINLIQKGV